MSSIFGRDDQVPQSRVPTDQALKCTDSVTLGRDDRQGRDADDEMMDTAIISLKTV